MQADFNTLRGAGLKAVVRFAYTQDSTAPFGDVSKAQIISHLAQLGPVLQANGDVIAVVQRPDLSAPGANGPSPTILASAT